MYFKDTENKNLFKYILTFQLGSYIKTEKNAKVCLFLAFILEWKCLIPNKNNADRKILLFLLSCLMKC